MKVVAILLLGATCVLGRPEVGIENISETRDARAQHLGYQIDAASLPLLQYESSAVPVLMYFPEYNAVLVPAESLSPEQLPSTKRRRPVANLIKLIQSRIDKEEPQQNTTFPTASELSQQTSTTEKVQNSETDSENAIQVNLTTTQSPIPKTKVTNDQSEGHTFSQVSQFFQRPNRPFFPSLQLKPPTQQFQIAPYFPAIAGYFQNKEPVRLPFFSYLDTKQPYQLQSESPREPYVQYYTKTPSSQAYYFNSYTTKVPLSNINSYGDAVQSEISDYVTRVHNSLLEEHKDALKDSDQNNSEKDSSVMVASLPVRKDQTTSLLLRPVAKAVAGPNGIAVASPVAKAVLRKGENVDIEYDPDAFAIAGPGGQAHAHPKLVITYTNDTSTE